jgi:hypothetical protein
VPNEGFRGFLSPSRRMLELHLKIDHGRAMYAGRTENVGWPCVPSVLGQFVCGI